MARQSETPDLHALIDSALAETPPGRVVWVGLSGGLDSGLLLTLAAEASRRHSRPLHALHVNHGLQDSAQVFEAHCRHLCTGLDVPLFVDAVEVDLQSGKGPEAAAREARYAAFSRHVAIGETLWLAQHRDDQAETFLLAALRGSGIRGLAAMPPSRDWQGRRLERPLLTTPRAALRAAAVRLGLEWIEDPSNVDTAMDRNFLRRRVLPLLETRWPQAAGSLACSAALAGETDALLTELAELDLQRLGATPERLPLPELGTMSAPRQRLLIRHACRCLSLPTPPARRLDSLLMQLEARPDAEVRVDWPGGEARLWRRALYLREPPLPLPAGWQREWNGVVPLPTPERMAGVWLMRRDGLPARLSVMPRQGGERLDLAGRGRRDLKRLLQEAELPPWTRQRLLVVWHDDNPVAVLGMDEPCWLVLAEGWEGGIMSGAHGD
jgi:tRNA(Ile)-lysidine synthase